MISRDVSGVTLKEMARVTRPVIVLEIKLIQRTMALETSLVVQIVCNL